MMNQYFQKNYIKVVNFSFFSLLIFVGIIAPFSFLKHKVIFEKVTDKKLLTANQSTYISNNRVEHKLVEKSENKHKTPKKIVKVKKEKPLHDVVLPNFKNIKEVKEKKRRFFAFIKPSIEKHHKQLLNTRDRLLALRKGYLDGSELSYADRTFINALSKKYKVKNHYSDLSKLNRLIIKVDIVPIPLTLVQAANESAWGTSRFSRVGLNFFGIWCFKKGCGMVPNGRDVDAEHEVEAFKSVDDAISKYTHNINTNRAYREFRQIRKQLREENLPLSSSILATGLIHYSERGIEYVNELIEMIRFNQRYFGA